MHTYTVQFVTDVGTERIRIAAPDNYTARTEALVAQDARPGVRSARIRQGSSPFAGPWFDLNEEH